MASADLPTCWHPLCRCPVVFFGTGLVEDNWHDSDESVRVHMLKAGAVTLAFLWEELGRRD